MSRFYNWLKEKKTWIIFWIGLLIIVTLSFGIGYLVAKEVNPAPIIIEKSIDYEK
ncbi:MAG: hypothetical protein QMD50_03315 [Patescibacteria group bacterium]|nr:hypothetical protein [Patescibacteria group bacterium]